MSGIVGLFHRDGLAVDPSELARMLGLIGHRGPDGGRIVCEGEAGFGHAMLWTTPESLNEVLPRTDEARRLTITADARIDNRDDLIDELGLTGDRAGIS